MIFTILVCFFAGMGAGIGTGFAGMSAAAVISPMLITFLGMDPYQAVGIALASDVLASAVSAYTYGKNKNLDVANGIVMMVTVLLFTLLGSYIASLLPSRTMGGFSMVMTLLLGVKFIVKPVMTTKEAMQAVSKKKRFIQSVICGMLIGFICGFVGAGGGLMMLLILTSVYGIYRCGFSFCDRRHAGYHLSGAVRAVHVPVGKDCGTFCKQGKTGNVKPCNRSGTCDSGDCTDRI